MTRDGSSKRKQKSQKLRLLSELRSYGATCTKNSWRLSSVCGPPAVTARWLGSLIVVFNPDRCLDELQLGTVGFHLSLSTITKIMGHRNQPVFKRTIFWVVDGLEGPELVFFYAVFVQLWHQTAPSELWKAITAPANRWISQWRRYPGTISEMIQTNRPSPSRLSRYSNGWLCKKFSLLLSNQSNADNWLSLFVLLTQNMKEDYGLFVWPCSIVLAEYVWQQRLRFSGATVVEVCKSSNQSCCNYVFYLFYFFIRAYICWVGYVLCV